MTPIAAYYVFVATEQERASQTARGLDLRPRRPSLLSRIRALVATPRQQGSAARAA